MKADVSDSFIGSIASIFAKYPRQVVLKCCDPHTGLVSEAKFLSISDLVGWCERKTEPMRMDVHREQRREKQINDREAWKATFTNKPNPNQITYKEFLEHCQATNQKPRPVGAYEPGGYLGRSE